ncbi:hypothetical protein [Neisseria shayeganii]|uniref:Uncharacterized protein n=1 Tax=Neisseria shayeganii 871 TaxID=1032488 RepID=G4CEP4_9NEIS|nr:hypothetical protein [Neisseria shayeganii]EGY53696.1 hypothetical protein HMPREF9371_0083 [Neisseria shayeganii 871]
MGKETVNEINPRFGKYSLSALWISSLILFILLLAAALSDSLSDFLGNKSILAIIAMLFIWINMHFTKVVSIQISGDWIKIIDEKSNKVTVFLENNIENYHFSISKKGWLDVLRVKVDGKNKYFWLGGVGFNEAGQDTILKNKRYLLEGLEQALPTKHKVETIDSIILFSGTKLPYILAAIAIGMVLFFLVYVFFYIE